MQIVPLGDKRSWNDAPPAVPRRARHASPAEDARDSGVSVDQPYTNTDDHRNHHKGTSRLNVLNNKFRETLHILFISA